jgi:hypothetical protein
VVLEEYLQVFATDLLLALYDQLDVHREPRAGAQFRLQRLYVHVDLSFVVLRAPSIHAAVADVGLERRCRPQVLGVRGLHVVVPVDKDGGTLHVGLVLGVDHGVAVCL